MGPETKDDRAGEGQQQFTGLDWTDSKIWSWVPWNSEATNDCAGEGHKQFNQPADQDPLPIPEALWVVTSWSGDPPEAHTPPPPKYVETNQWLKER
jgi:hypothetical protein